VSAAALFKWPVVAACALIAAGTAAADGLAVPKSAKPAVSDDWRATVIPGTCVRPEYPLSSIRRQETGTSIIELKLDENGTVTGSSVRQSSGSRLLDQAAAQSLSLCRFNPARDSTGTPMASSYPMRFEWRLENAPSDPWVAMREVAGGGFAPTEDFGTIPFAGDSASSIEQRARMLRAARDEALDKALCPSVEKASARVAYSDTAPDRRSLESWTLEQCGKTMRYAVVVLFPQAKPPRFRMVPLAPAEADPFAAR
jgi:TonB family protein